MHKYFFLAIVSMYFFTLPLTADINSNDVSRLNTLLNSRRMIDYGAIKEYPQQCVLSLEGLMLADCKIIKTYTEEVVEDPSGLFITSCITKDKNLEITLYFDFIRTHNGDSTESREEFAHRIKQIISLMCRDILQNDLASNEIRIIAKHSKKPEYAQRNLLFIWENGEVTYFPLLFL